MPFTNSPNMGLPIPGISQEPGPQYAQDVNQALLVLDSHTHAPGNGVQIGAQGINLTSDLAFNVNNATTVRSVRFVSTTASSGTDIGCIYVKGVDLFYNDLNANNIRITQNGGLSTTATFIGLLSTTAIVSANGNAPATSGFIRMNNNLDYLAWRNAANNADDKLYFDSSDALNIVGPAYNLVLPNAVSTSAMPVIQSTLGVLTANSQLTRPMLPVVGQQTGSVGSFNGASSAVILPFITAAPITTTGRPVMCVLQATSTGGGSYWTTTGDGANFYFFRNSNRLCQHALQTLSVGSSAQQLPVNFMFVDTPPSSTYTYSMQYNSLTGTMHLQNAILMVYEL